MMIPRKTRQWVLSNKPTELPVLSGPNATFELVEIPLPPLQEDHVLVKVLYLSNDPSQRVRIEPSITPDRLPVTPVNVGDVMIAQAVIAEVIESRSSKIGIGALVTVLTGWTEYSVVAQDECLIVPTVHGLTPLEVAGMFGMAAVTAYYGLVDIVKAGPQDAIVVSGAGGAVGSVAIQIAKHILGCRKVIGIAGSDSKCRWVQSLGADACLNYKSDTFEAELNQATEGFVEVFFDNVGGEVLDLVLKRMQDHGRVAACGVIAGYNTSTPYGVKNWYYVVAMRIQIFGFIVLDAMVSGRWDEIVSILIQNYQAGRLKAFHESATIVKAGIQDVPGVWMRLFNGQSLGKLLTQLV